MRDIPFVVIVGGSALDFEIPQLVTDALSQYALVAGRGNIRSIEGARNAVATGLVLSYSARKGSCDGSSIISKPTILLYATSTYQ